MKFLSTESLIATTLVAVVSTTGVEAKPIEECLAVRKSFGSCCASAKQCDVIDL